MPFGTNDDLSQLSAPDSWSMGPSASLADNFSSSFQRQKIVDSAFGMQVDLRDAYLGQLDKVKNITGDDVNPNWPFALDAIGAGIGRQAGAPIGFGGYDATIPQLQTGYLGDIDKIDASITKAKAVDPSLQTFSELYTQELAKRQQALQTSVSVGDRSSGLPDALASLAGGLAGSMDFQRDPLFVGSMFLPMGWARSAAMKLIASGVVSGATMGAQDTLFSGPRAEALGEPPPDTFNDILTGAVGGLIAHGLHEAIPFAYRKLVPKATDEGIPSHINTPVLDSTTRLENISDGTLYDVLTRDPNQTPDVVAATTNLANEIATQELSPIANTREGVAQTQDQVQAATDLFENGGRAPVSLNPDNTMLPEGPSADQVIRDVVQQKQAGLYDQLDDATSKLADAQQALEIAVKQQEQFNTGADFDAEVQKVKDSHDAQTQELDQIRREGKQPETHPEVVAGKARIAKQTHDALTTVGQTRFVAKNMLREEVGKARRVTREQAARVERLKAGIAKAETEAQEAVAPKPKAVQKAARANEPLRAVPRPTDDLKKLKDEIVTPEKQAAIIDRARQSLKESLQASVDEKQPPKTVRLFHGGARGEGKRGPKDFSTDLDFAKGYASKSGEKALVYYLDLPEDHPLMADRKGLADGEVPRTIYTGVPEKVAKLMQPFEPSIDMGGPLPIPADLEVPDDAGGTRSAAKVLEEMDDEDAMVKASTECGLGAGK